MARILALAVLALLVSASPATAGGGSPFDGHYAGASLNGRHHVDVNINGGRARTANLQLACAGGRRVFADFLLNDALSASGRFTATARSSQASVRGGVTVKLHARVRAGRLTGTLTAKAGVCKVGPLQFTLPRSGE
jgi:hypothetical protein